MTANKDDGTTDDKSTDAARVRRTFPGPMEGIRYEADCGFSTADLESGWLHSEIDTPETAGVAVEVRDKHGEPGELEAIGFSVELEDEHGSLEAYAEVEPETAAELARAILDEVGGADD